MKHADHYKSQKTHPQLIDLQPTSTHEATGEFNIPVKRERLALRNEPFPHILATMLYNCEATQRKRLNTWKEAVLLFSANRFC